ncbi:hypothetical protein H9Q69_003701 [Fusarium xylarioides]|nr:hypothetical protein H9Q69_003701 [Fusarium xylarioides]
MVSGTPPNPSSHDACYISSRCSFISLYLEYAGHDATAKWDDCLKMAFEQVMKSLGGLTQVSHDWLEYEADRVAWKKLFSELAIEGSEWPFTMPPRFDAPDKIAEGISPTYLWQSVVDWAIEAYFGGTMSLATFLRVRKAVPVAHSNSYHSRELTSWTREAYGEVQSDPMYFIRVAHENRTFLAECRAEVLEIVEKPLTEAKAKLSRWVIRRGYYDERLQAAREIRVSSTTDERSIQEALIWAWGPHEMAIISAENTSS